MRKTCLKATLAAAALLSAAAPASLAAQSDILLRLTSGSPATDRFRVDSAGGLVSLGTLGLGVIPATGAGERMMWYPYKAAWRAGSVNGTQWDDSNVGFYSLAGGYNTIATGLASFAMGYQSQATGSYSTAFGYTANATSTGSVALGYRSTANANYAVAIGQRASANSFTGAIVLSDASSTDSVTASANNQFSLRAAGGVRLYTNATKTTGVTLNAGGSSWNVVSDRNRKESFLGIDGEDILARLRGVPVTTWRYRDEADRTVRHIGPMAQDWHRAFGFSADATTINMSDLDGVNLAAVRALEARTAGQARQLEAQRQEIQAVRAENAALRAQNQRLEERLRRLEATAGVSTP
ncbi:MAG TPA: tail fiber domain-containing protein [Longimicrobium sp.]|nr:tail fiber domain-containing protein [Longimicrobium sp.]